MVSACSENVSLSRGGGGGGSCILREKTVAASIIQIKYFKDARASNA